jgi:hypothetical protein
MASPTEVSHTATIITKRITMLVIERDKIDVGGIEH